MKGVYYLSKILLIIPSYNEEKNVKKVVDSICNYNDSHDQKYDALFINDGSKDNTEKELCLYNCNHVTLIQNLGIGGAVQTGYKYALDHNYDIAIQMDGDGQHDINYVKHIIKPIQDGYANLVIGSRFIDFSSSKFKSSLFRRFGIKLISAAIKIKTGKRIYDTTSGFRAADYSVINEFAANYPTEYPEPISTTFLLKSDFKVSEVAVSMYEREHGVSSIQSWKNIYYIINVIISILLLKGKRK